MNINAYVRSSIRKKIGSFFCGSKQRILLTGTILNIFIGIYVNVINNLITTCKSTRYLRISFALSFYLKFSSFCFINVTNTNYNIIFSSPNGFQEKVLWFSFDN